MYRMCDQIEDISLWYAKLPAEEKLRWKHPQTVAKHCPAHLLKGGAGGNKPPRKMPVKKKRASTAEEDRLRQILIMLVNEFVMPMNPQRAAELLKGLYPEGDPNDSLEGIGDNEDADADADADADVFEE
jgi:hypothetical protein